MKFTKMLNLGVAILLAFLLMSCGGAPEPTHTPQSSNSGIVHTGDMWYLPVNLDGLPEANMEAIFTIIGNWQREHPKLEIVDVDFHYMQRTYSEYTSNYTYGVSLLTKSK